MVEKSRMEGRSIVRGILRVVDVKDMVVNSIDTFDRDTRLRKRERGELVSCILSVDRLTVGSCFTCGGTCGGVWRRPGRAHGKPDIEDTNHNCLRKLREISRWRDPL